MTCSDGLQNGESYPELVEDLQATTIFPRNNVVFGFEFPLNPMTMASPKHVVEDYGFKFFIPESPAKVENPDADVSLGSSCIGR